MPPWASIPTERLSSLPASRFPSIAGRGMTWAVSRTPGRRSGGGLAVTGNYPGKARTADELRADFEEALSVIPGPHRLNLHACYAEMSGRKVERDELSVEQFKNWIAWARAIKIGLDFNPTYFRPSQGRWRNHAHQPRQGHPPVLDRARHPLPRDRRRHRQGAGQDLPHQPLDSRRHEGYPRRPPRPARAPGRVARRGVQEEDRQEIQRGLGGAQAVRHRRGELHARLRTSSTSAMPSAARSCSRWMPAITIRPRASRTRFPRCSATCRRSRCTSAAGCAGTATTSSR